MVKKILAAVVAASVMAVQPTFAVEIETKFDVQTKKMEITGAIPEDEALDSWVTIEVINSKTGKTVFLTQTETDDELNFGAEMTYEVDLDYQSTDPLYKIRVNYMHDGDAEETEVYYTPDALMQMYINIATAENAGETLEALKNADLDELARQLELEGENIDAEAIAELIYEKTSSRSLVSVEDCVNCIREAVIFNEIKTGGAAKINEYIALAKESVGNTIGMDSNNKMYILYSEASQKIKDAFDGMMKEYYDNSAELQKAYAQQLLLAAIKNSDNNLQIVQALDACGNDALEEVYETSKYADLSKQSDKERFAGILKDKASESADGTALLSAFKSAETEYSESGSSSSQPSGGSSSGSKGTGGSKSTGSSISIGGKTADTAQPLITDMFRDLESVPWAKEAINELAKKKIVSGINEDTFEPDRFITREEFIKLLVAACDINTSGAKSSFDDVLDTDWFYPYVSAAFEEEIAAGVSENFFGTGSYISREDMAVTVYRVLQKKELIGEDAEAVVFGDNAEISEYAKIPVGTIAAMGIINGTGDNKFSPSENATRAQAAKIIYGLINKIK